MGLSLRGQTSGAIDINAPNVAGDNTITLPVTNGAANQFYKNSGTAGIVTHSSMVEDSSGRIGINEISPSSYSSAANSVVISAASGSNAGITINNDSSGTDTGAIFFAHGTPENAVGRIRYYHSDNHMEFYTANAERVRIDSSGRMLIGTTTAPGFAQADDFTVSRSTDAGITIRSGTAHSATLAFSDGTGGGASEYRGLIQYSHLSNSLAFSTNSDERLRIDSSGNVLLGKTTTSITTVGNRLSSGLISISASSTSTNLAVNAGGSLSLCNTNATNNNFSNIGGYNSNGLVVSQIDFVNVSHAGRTGDIAFLTHNGTSMSERMRINSGGFVGINETAPGAQLTVKRANTSTTSLNGVLKLKQGNATNGNNASMLFSSLDDFDVAAVTGIIETHSGTESNNEGRLEFWTKHSGSALAVRGRIDSEGSFFNLSENHGIYTESSVGAGTVKYLYRGSNSSGSNIVFNVWSNGDVESATNSFGPVSDLKLKENIVDAGSQWADIKSVKFRKFNFKEETGYQTHTQLGVIAQELEAISPGLVYETPDMDREGKELGTTTKKVKASVLTMKAMVALQEAMAKIETLETQNADLLSRVTALEG